MTTSILLVLFQASLIALVCLGEIGFDHPGKYGLDFDAFLVIAAFYMIALLVGLVRSCVRKEWKFVAVQLVLPLSLLAFEAAPRQSFNANQYQHLVGKTKQEVAHELGQPKIHSSGFVHGPHGEVEFVKYDGMMIKYSTDGRVLSVEP
jgi:hypothetical protein